MKLAESSMKIGDMTANATVAATAKLGHCDSHYFKVQRVKS